MVQVGSSIIGDTSQKGTSKCHNKFNHHKTPLLHHDRTSCVACQRFHSRPLIALAKSSKNVGKHRFWVWLPNFLKKKPGIIIHVKFSIRYQKRCALENIFQTFIFLGGIYIRQISGRVQVYQHLGASRERRFVSENSPYGQLIQWLTYHTFGQFIYNYPLKIPSCAGK